MNTSESTQTPKIPVPCAPTRSQLIQFYCPQYAPNTVKSLYCNIRKEFKAKVNSRAFTKAQFIEFIRELGLPKGYKKEDIPWLDGIEIH